MLNIFAKAQHVRDLEDELDASEMELARVKVRLDEALTELENLTNAAQKTARSASVVIDFETLNAFSVERVCRKGVAHTSIGYVFDNKVREWILYCNEDIHEALADEFAEYLSGKETDE